MVNRDNTNSACSTVRSAGDRRDPSHTLIIMAILVLSRIFLQIHSVGLHCFLSNNT